MTACDLELEILPPYIGSAVSPTVDITETTDDITVTITDFRGEHAYTVDKTDQAIADAEQAASNANTAAANATSTANQAAQYARQTADQAAADAQATADEAAGRADTAAASATSAAQAATQAAGTANTAASNADTKAALADSKATLANQAATTANQAAEAAEAAKTAANTAAGQATTAAGNATTAAGTANTAATNADAKAQLAETAATNADTAAQAANTATTNATNAAQAANNAADVAIEAAETIQDGYFPHMLAGAAESLMDETDTATFSERVSTHDGVARIEAIQGNTVVWNQVAPNETYSTQGSKAFAQGTQIVAGHKYLFSANFDVTAAGTANSALSVYCHNGEQSVRQHRLFAPNAGSAVDKAIFTATVDGVSIGTTSNVAGNIWLYYALSGATADVGEIQLFDLTRMFGVGNEPATVAEFEAMFPADYYPYSAGELLSVNIEGVNDREIPVSTYFPDGMKSAGSVHDELTASKAIKRVGVVAASSLTWTKPQEDVFQTFGYDVIPGMPNKSVVGVAFDGYIHVGNARNSSTSQTTDQDKTFRNYYNSTAPALQNGLFVKDTAYSTVEEFTASLANKYILYELAEPVETEIAPPLTMTYTVENGGTESIVIPTGEQSAAPTLAIVYGLTADGVVDKALSVIAPIEGATASTNYSVNAYLVHDQQLYRVTSAIATGEAITPGSNCVACTVMGEVIRLTA